MKNVFKFAIFIFIAVFFCVSCSIKNDIDISENIPDEKEVTELEISDIIFPADSDVMEFQKFKKRVALFEFVTTGCCFCPYVMAATNMLCEQPEKSDDFCVIASYTKYNRGLLNNKYSSMFEKQISDYSVPKMYFDANKRISYSFNRNLKDLSENVIYKSKVLSTIEKYPAKVAITAKSIIEDEKVKVDVGLKLNDTGVYNVQIVVVEDDVKCYQDNSERVKGYDFRNHNHVLQYALVNDYKGKPLKDGQEIASYSYYAEKFEFAVPENIKNIENCRLIVYIVSGKYVTNSIEMKINGGVVPFEYEKVE